MIRPRLELRRDTEIGAEEATAKLGNKFFAGAIRPVLGISRKITSDPMFSGRVAKLAIGRVEPIITQLSRFVNLLKSEEAPEQIILIVDGPLAGKAEAFPQPQHRFEPGDRPARRFE